jgi:hypothetical protein
MLVYENASRLVVNYDFTAVITFVSGTLQIINDNYN